LLLTPGVFLTLHALSVYPLLDSRIAMGCLLCGFLFPAALNIASILRNRPDYDPAPLRKAYMLSAFALVFLGAVLHANGMLDRSPVTQMHATVLQKTMIRGRATQRHLFVSSWRPGRAREHFIVSPSVYESAAVGKPVAIDVHAGYFGFPWHGQISAD